jgi:hypothetical protein
VKLTPGARYFLAQRKAQGITDVTEDQAHALAALMVPVQVGTKVCPAELSGPRGNSERRAS